MKFEEKNNKFVVSFNELEIDNILMASKAVEWLKKQERFQDRKYICGWQVVENARPFHDKRGFVIESNFKDKVAAKFAIKSGNVTYYFAIFELTDSDITSDLILRNGGHLFFLDGKEQIKVFCEELENILLDSKDVTEKLILDTLVRLVGTKQGSVFGINDFDDQAGNCAYTFSLS